MQYAKLPGLVRKLRRSGYPKIPLTKSDELALLQGCYFDADKGWKPVDYIEYYCKTSQGEHSDQPIRLLEWQAEGLLVPSFGWMKPDHRRRISKIVVFVPKKNGKSTLCSAISAYLADPQGDDENGSLVLLTATAKDQARTVYDEAALMVESSEQLGKRFKVSRSSHVITYKDNSAKIQVIAADAKTSQGKNAHGLIIDEIHAWTNRDFYGSIRYAGAARSQPMTFIISTAGEDEYSLGGTEYNYAKKVLAGDIEDTRIWPIIFEADPKTDDLESEETWFKCNPSLGYTMPVDNFRADFLEAKVAGGKDWDDFKRYRLNIWGGASSPYINLKKWQKSKGNFTEKDLEGMECYAGVDLASKEDITSIAYLFKLDNEFKLILRHFCPEDKVKELLKRGDKKYYIWWQQKYLTVMPGSRIEQDSVLEIIKQDFRKFSIKYIAIESWNAQYFYDEILKITDNVVEAYPSYKQYSEPTKEFKALIDDKKIKHIDDPVMNWMVSNLHVQENNFLEVMPKKKDKKKKYKIDGCQAAILAVKLSLQDKNEEEFQSVYETDDFEL